MRPIFMAMAASACLFMAAASAQAADQDLLRLKDGVVIHGTVLEENDNNVVILSKGIKRKVSRSRIVGTVIAGVDSQAEADAQDTEAAAEPTDSAADPDMVPVDLQADYINGVSDYYEVPREQVVLVHDMGIPVEEVPVVFFIERRAHCGYRHIVDLRLGGTAWVDILFGLNLRPDIFWFNAGDPFDDAYASSYYYRPRSAWRRWRMRDDDVINCVNVRYVSAYNHVAPSEAFHFRHDGQRFTNIWGHYRAPNRPEWQWHAPARMPGHAPAPRPQVRVQGNVNVPVPSVNIIRGPLGVPIPVPGVASSGSSVQVQHNSAQTRPLVVPQGNGHVRVDVAPVHQHKDRAPRPSMEKHPVPRPERHEKQKEEPKEKKEHKDEGSKDDKGDRPDRHNR